jgi:hypothetical protein
MTHASQVRNVIDFNNADAYIRARRIGFKLGRPYTPVDDPLNGSWESKEIGGFSSPPQFAREQQFFQCGHDPMDYTTRQQ